MSAFERELRELIERIVDERVEKRLAELRQPDEFVSTADAARIAGVHADTIRRWIREGRLAEHRAGRVVRVKRADVEKLLANGRRQRREDRDLTPEEQALRDFG